MAYTATRTGNVFIAGEDAPNAVEVADLEELIINHVGNIALRLSQDVEPDTTQDPAVLHLNEAEVTALFGQIGQDGEFEVFDNELSASARKVSGDYTGPGSKLELI